MTAILKETSSSYGAQYQKTKLNDYLGRRSNNWRFRLEVAERLVRDFVLQRLNVPPSDIVTVDIGCSIGTFAIEFAKRGYRSYGIDFDPEAIHLAKQLSAQEGVSPTF